MFIWWGARNEVASVGTAGLKHCTVCNQDSWFERVVTYRLRHAYGLFRWVTGRQLHQLCGNCGASYLDEGDVRDADVKKAVPRFDRFGWLAAPAILVSLGGLGAVAAQADDAANQRYLAQPQVGDLYQANLARMMPTPQTPTMFSAMRVVRTEGDQVELEVAQNFYEDRRGVERDINQGRVARPGYFAPDHLTIPRAGLAKMYADGVVTDVRRP